MEALQDTFKDTKIGRIPKDWEVTMLSEIGIIKVGRDLNKGIYSSKFNEKYKVPVYSNAITDRGLYGFYSRSEYPPNSITITGRGNIGFAFQRDQEFGAIGRLIVIQPNSNVDYVFLTNYINHSVNFHIETSGIPQLTGVQASKYKVALPPLPEQQKIAAILSTVDEQISTTDKIIEKSKELKKGLMQKLFSEGIGHTEFKDTKIGRIPKDWEILKINKVADCYGGTTPSTIVKEYWSGDILWATPSDITKNKSEFLLDTNRKITEQGRASKNLRFVKKNGLLMTSRASIGFLNISNGDVVTNQGFINIECKDNFHYKFFYYWVLDNRKKLLSLSQGSTFLELNRKTFAKINIPVPPLPEQQKIADLLSEADAKIEKEQSQKAQLEALKKGLMQQLLTGKKRVTI